MRNLLARTALYGLLTAFTAGAVATAPAPARAQEAAPKHAPGGTNKEFEKPDLDVEGFIKRFETESRDVYAQRSKIVAAVGLRPGGAAADVGAGTGLFTWLFAEKVGSEGTVYAVEIAPAFLKHLERQTARRGLEKVVKTVRSTQDSTNLPPESVDVVFICDAYHHFERPAKFLTSIRQALRPEGRLVIVDFDLREDSSEFIRGHARAPKETYFKEIESAGFKQVAVESPPVMKENFFVAFQRVNPAPPAPSKR